MPASTVLNDPTLPSLELAWSPGQLLEVLNTHVLPIVRPAERAVELEIEYVVYTPGRKCLIKCAYHLAENRAETPKLALISMSRDGRAHWNGLESDAIFVDDYDCLVELFPTDVNLPSLRSVLSPETMSSLLTNLGRAHRNWLPPEVLHYRPHRRCVVRYRPDDPAGDGSSDVIVKVYPWGPKARIAADKMSALRTSAAHVGLLVPEPLAVSDDLSVLLMECAPGISMNQSMSLSPDNDAARRTAGLVADALTTLHTLTLESNAEPRTLASEVRRSRRHVERLKLVAPDLAHSAEVLFDRIASKADKFPFEVVSVSHGDFTLNQLLRDGDNVAMVDFDRAAPGDPALDVGNLMAKLDRDTLNSPAGVFDGVSDGFLEQYQAASGRGHALAERTQLVRALAFVRGAVRGFRHAPKAYVDGGASSRPILYLEQARRCLEQL